MTLREITYMFPAPGIDVSKSSDPTAYNTFVSLESSTLQKRWQDADGIAILHTLRGNNFERAVLEKAVGRINGKFDLRGIPLDQCDLRGVDLSDCDLYRSTLRDANLSRANFAGSFLSEADIRGANFDWCRLDGTYLDNVTFDSKTSFLGVDLNGVNFTLAARVRELALSQQIIK